MTQQKYRTAPLECYAKARELRLGHFRDIMTAREEGKLLVGGSVTIGLYELPAGLGNVVCFADDEYAVSIAANVDFCLQASAAAEARGFSRNICGYTLNYTGSMFLDRFLYGGHFPRPDLIFTGHNCDARGKWSQIVADHLKIPIFVYENPCRRAGKPMGHHIDYLVGQFSEGIEWMEKVTGRRYDDEKLIEAVRNYFHTARLWGEILLLNRNIPAPLDARALVSLLAIPISRRHEKVGVEFLETLKDELRYRVDGGIAASPSERGRLLLENIPHFAALPLLRRLQQEYGIVWLGTMAYAGVYSEIEIGEDGILEVTKTPEERGLPLKTREDALRALAMSIRDSWLEQRIAFPVDANPLYIALAKGLRADGVVLDVNKSCPANAASTQERKLAFQKAGIPVTIYESSASTPAGVDVGKICDVIELFLEESLGMKKLPK